MSTVYQAVWHPAACQLSNKPLVMRALDKDVSMPSRQPIEKTVLLT